MSRLFLMLIWLGLISASVGAGSAAPSLFQARQATLAARTEPDVFCGAAVDAHTDIVAFPTGESDRLYTYSYGIGRAYMQRGNRAELVWCGKALYTKQDAARWASRLPGNAAHALSYQFGTKWGRLPNETGDMNIYSGFAGSLRTLTMSAAGKVACSRTRGDPVNGEFRTAVQFSADDTCP